jgi:AbrB family looped-hinge helix DNA binding protein
MTEVTVSPKFQIVIPKQLRERLKLKPGQKLLIYDVEGTLRLVTARPLREMRGLARGIRWQEADRDHTERL